MADAKITIETIANNEGLAKLNDALADGAQRVKTLQTELRQLEKDTNNGTKATAEQAAKMRELQKALNEQKQGNKELGIAINETIKELKNQGKAAQDTQSGISGLISRMTSLKGISDTVSTALGVMAGNILTNLASGALDAGKAVLSLGMGMEKQVAGYEAMGMSSEQALAVHRQFDELARNTNFGADKVMTMSQNMLNLGIASDNVSRIITNVGNAAAGLKLGEQGADALAQTMARILATGRLSQKQIDQLKISGIDAVKVIADATGQTQEEITKALSKGAIDGQAAFEALSNYMETNFAGAMNTSKNNVVDTWGDISGNITSSMAEIGNSIASGFNQTGILQELVDMTQSFLNLIQSDGIGIFEAFGAVVSPLFEGIRTALSTINTVMKLTMVIVKEMADGFRNMCDEVYEKLRWLIEPLNNIWQKVKSIVGTIGNDIKEYTDKVYNETFKPTTSATPSVQLSNRAASDDTAAGTLQTTASAYERVATAQKKVISNAKELNDTQDYGATLTQRFGEMFQSTMGGMLNGTGITLDGMAGQFADFAKSIIKEMTQIIIKGLIMKAVTGIFGGGGTISGSSFGLGSTPSGMFSGGSILPSVNSGTIGLFANGGTANGWAIVGENGPELVKFNSPGRVYNNNDTRSMLGGGASNIKVELINQSGTDMEAKQGGVNFDGEKYIVSVILKAMSNNQGGLRDVMKGAAMA